MPQYVQPVYNKRFSSTYPANIEQLVMDLPLPQGSVGFNNVLNATGTGTTNATVGTTESITHNLGFVPNFISITETSDGTVYLDTATLATATTFNVKGSAASLTFNWKAE